MLALRGLTSRFLPGTQWGQQKLTRQPCSYIKEVGVRPQYHQRLIGPLIGEVMMKILTQPGACVNILTSPYGQRNIEQLCFQNHHSVYFRQIQSPQNQLQIDGQIQRVDSASYLWPVFNKAFRNPNQTVVGHPVRPGDLGRQRLSVLHVSNLGFDSLVVRFTEELNLFQAWPIDWRVKWPSLSSNKDQMYQDSNDQEFPRSNPQEQLPKWWQNHSSSLSNIITSMTKHQQFKLNMYLTVMCPGSIYNLQRKALTENPRSYVSKANQNMILSTIVGNAQNMTVENVADRYKQSKIRQHILNVKHVEIFRKEQLERIKIWQEKQLEKERTKAEEDDSTK